MNFDDIKKHLQNEQTVYLSTSAAKQPHVRAMALIYYNDTFWSCTLLSRKKVAEVQENNLVEFCLPLVSDKGTGSIRAAGELEIIEDQNIREELSREISFFPHFFESYDSPEFVLFRYNLETVVFHNPEDRQFYTFPAK